MSWEPQSEGVKELSQLLWSTFSHNTDVRRDAEKKLDEFGQRVPDFCNYLVFIMGALPSDGDNIRIRRMAGLILKNTVRKSGALERLPRETLSYIQSGLSQMLSHPLKEIRLTVTTIVATLVQSRGFQMWPNLLVEVRKMMDSNDSFAIAGAVDLFRKISEDQPTVVVEMEGDPLQSFVPKLLSLVADTSTDSDIRHRALSSLLQYFRKMPPALSVNMALMIQALTVSAVDNDPRVVEIVCRIFRELLRYPQYLEGSLPGILEYILNCNVHSEENVVLESSMFWSDIVDIKGAKELVEPILPRLIPVLLENMKYSEFELSLMGGDEEDDSNVPDRVEDINPRSHMHRTKLHVLGMQGELHIIAEMEDDDYDDLEEVEGWSVRKSSAASLDIIASVFGQSALPFLLGEVSRRIQDPEWSRREAAILAFGAISDGCYEGLKDHLPDLFHYLFDRINDSRPLIRSISCWVLSRYARWPLEQHNDELFGTMLNHLLQHLLDKNKRVQGSACSAVANVEEEALERLEPFVPQILTALMGAYGKYQTKNMIILYDCLGTLAECLGDVLADGKYLSAVVPPLLERWNTMAVAESVDVTLFPLIECLTAISASVGTGYQQYAEFTFGKCVEILGKTMVIANVAGSKGDFSYLKDMKDISIAVLDLIATMVEHLGPWMIPMLSSSGLVSTVTETLMTDEFPDLRQSAFALVGEMSKATFALLTPVVPRLLDILSSNLDKVYPSVCNNACWALGEISAQMGESIAPYVEPILGRIIPLLHDSRIRKSLFENVAITAGRLGYAAPGTMAPHLRQYFRSWCIAMKHLEDQGEKSASFRGMLRCISLNAEDFRNEFFYFCEAVAYFRRAEEDLMQSIHSLLHSVKNSMPPNVWEEGMRQFSDRVRDNLRVKYSV